MLQRVVVGMVAVLCLLTVAPVQAQEAKRPKWAHGLDMKARPVGEPMWEKAKKFGVEVFKDENNGNLVYITSDGQITVVSGQAGGPGQDSKGAKYLYGSDIKVRPAGEGDWAKAKKYGVEVFKDENNNCQMYLTYDGQLAVVPGKEGSVDKGPKWVHGLDVKARPAGEADWDKAKKFGIEVFKDENNGNLQYITQDGNLAVVPGKDGAAGEKTPKWVHGLDLKARPAGESAWGKAKKFGVEVFRDENNGYLVYVTGDGQIAVVPGQEGGAADKGAKWAHGLDLNVRTPGEAGWEKAKKFGIEVYRDENNGNLVYITQDGMIAVAKGQ